MGDQPKALRLADALEREYSGCHADENDFLELDAAAELRRLHALNAELVEALRLIAHATAASHDDGAGHEDAHYIAHTALAKVEASK